MITVTGPSYLDVLMRVPHLAQEGEMLKAACDGVGLHVDWVPCARTARALVLVPAGGERTIYTGHLPGWG